MAAFFARTLVSWDLVKAFFFSTLLSLNFSIRASGTWEKNILDEVLSRFWNRSKITGPRTYPFIPVFIPTMIMDEVLWDPIFHLNLLNLSFVDQGSMKTQNFFIFWKQSHSVVEIQSKTTTVSWCSIWRRTKTLRVPSSHVVMRDLR